MTQLNIRYVSVSSSLPSVMELVVCENGEKHVELLHSTNDEHEGVTIEMKEPMDADVFAASLKASLSHWKEQGKRDVWIKLPIELANLVEVVVKEGFWYHHAEPNYLILVYWIPKTENTIPANASHRVGVGAFVMNDKREVLVVQEKNGELKGKGIWKFPTGVIEEGEEVHMGVIREVKEETGIDTEFVEILAFRQSHKVFFGKSDLFFMCMLRPLSFDIQKQDLEIEAAQWMPFDEYAAQPFVQKSELIKYYSEICLAKIDKEYAGFSSVSKSTTSGKPGSLYCNSRDMNQQ